jgi:hypothetical protein
MVGAAEEKSPMTSVAETRITEPLPPSMAIGVNLALSLGMWNIVLRIVNLLVDA